MSSYPGAQVSLAMKLGATFGTATALGAGDRLTVDSLTRNENVTALERVTIGSGDSMKTDSQRGKTSPQFSFTADDGYNDPTVLGPVSLFGAQSTLAGATIATHSIYFNETAGSKYATLGAVFLGGSAVEYTSAACTKLAYTVSDPADYFKVTQDWLANIEKTSATTNSAATIEATTTTDATPVVVQLTDELLINGRNDVALATSTHRLSVKSISFTFERPQENIYEIRGTAGNSAPAPAGSVPFKGTITLETKDLGDQEFYLWQQAIAAGTEFKASLTVTDGSAAISGAVFRQKVFYFPRLKLTGSPEYSLSSPGRNGFKITLDMMVAVANPTGMIDRYPYITVRNGKLTDY